MSGAQRRLLRRFRVIVMLEGNEDRGSLRCLGKQSDDKCSQPSSLISSFRKIWPSLIFAASKVLTSKYSYWIDLKFCGSCNFCSSQDSSFVRICALDGWLCVPVFPDTLVCKSPELRSHLSYAMIYLIALLIHLGLLTVALDAFCSCFGVFELREILLSCYPT